MEATVQKVQTGLRFSPTLIARLKKEAKKNKKSFNGYVEDLLESVSAPAIPKLKREDFAPGKEILSLGETIPAFSEEEIDKDPKLAYLLAE